MKKLIIALLLCLLLTPALAEGGAEHTIDAKTLDFYVFDTDTVVPRTVYFIDGSDVPYLALSDWPDLLAAMPDDPDAIGPALPELTFSMAGNVGTLTREDGYSATFDCDADTIGFLDFDAFFRSGNETLLMDLVGREGNPDPDGEVRYFLRDSSSYERYGDAVKIDAGAYGIDFIAAGGDCYVPMQTLSDILLGHHYMNILYNGEAAFIVKYPGFLDSGSLTPLGEVFYSVEPHARTETLARFTYSELCMVLDSHYGLKDKHGITTFDDLFEDTGLKPALTGTDPVKADEALFQLVMHHLDDLHSYYRQSSPLSGSEALYDFGDALGAGQSRTRFFNEAQLYRDARAEVYPDGVPAYEEIGNTAFITFDSFIPIPSDVDYYETPPTAEAKDTRGILIYAYSQITREDSPIENVVLDLSCNMGGQSGTATYTLAAFLGTGSISVKNPLTGALSTGNYEIDINLDGVIDEKDKGLLDKNLFCLESPVTFSCGNLVTCAFKQSNRVMLIGRSSGGGACNVYAISTADGSYFQFSGLQQLSFLKNGSFYDIDRGAEPDYPLMKRASFYDRQALTEFINSVR